MRKPKPQENVLEAAVVQDSITVSGGFDTDDYIKLRGYIRTREVDTYRLTCPQQWNYAGMWFVKPENPGRYLGTANWTGVCLPHDDNDDKPRVLWKRLAGAIGAAEWAWTPGFPPTTFLRYLWFDPFMMLEKEVTW